MKSRSITQKLSLALAAIGLLMPNFNLVLAAQTVTPQQQTTPATKVVDVSLVDGGQLQGQVVNAEGIGQVNTPVTLHQGKEAIATVKTDKNGDFTVPGLKGGMYVVSTQGASGVVRAWAPCTSPPSAVKGILLVPGNQALRAQGVVQCFGVGGILIGTIVATVIAVSIDHSSNS